MPLEPSSEERVLASMANIASIKTKGMKKALSKIAAKFISRQRQQLPQDLISFLKDDDTFLEVLRVAKCNKQDILVRRYVVQNMSCLSFSAHRLVADTPCAI